MIRGVTTSGVGAGGRPPPPPSPTHRELFSRNFWKENKGDPYDYAVPLSPEKYPAKRLVVAYGWKPLETLE